MAKKQTKTSENPKIPMVSEKTLKSFQEYLHKENLSILELLGLSSWINFTCWSIAAKQTENSISRIKEKMSMENPPENS